MIKINKFVICIFTIITFSSLVLINTNENIENFEESNFLQSSLEEKEEKRCGVPVYNYDSCGGKGSRGCGFGGYAPSSSCGYGYGKGASDFGGYGYGKGSSCGYGYGKGASDFGGYKGYKSLGQRGYGYGDHGDFGGYGSRYGKGCSDFGRFGGYGGYRGAGADYGYGKGGRYFGKGCAGASGDDGFWQDGFWGTSGPSHSGKYASGNGHYNGNNHLRGKYISLEDAVALLGAEQNKNFAGQKAYKGGNSNKYANSGANYLDKNGKIEKKANGEYACDDANQHYGKNFRTKKCSSADANKLDRDHHFNFKKSHQKLNVKNGKKENLCMNANKLDKNFSDGKLLEEFDKLEHFKKCASGKKGNYAGNDMSIKKLHKVQCCKDHKSLAMNKDKKANCDRNRASAESKECTDYNDFNRANKNSLSKKRGKECNSERNLKKAGECKSEKDAECESAKSKGIAFSNNAKVLRKACDKHVKQGCLDKSKCISAGVNGKSCSESCESPAC